MVGVGVLFFVVLVSWLSTKLSIVENLINSTKEVRDRLSQGLLVENDIVPLFILTGFHYWFLKV